MKTSKKILALSVTASLLMLNNSYALTNPPVQQVAQVKVTSNTPMTLNVVNTPAVQPAQSVGSGNTFEKEVTPLLREISKKRSALDIRKLDRELEKLDEDAAKAQAEKEKSALTLQITAQNAQAPMATKAAPANMPAQAMPSEVRVLMIYGYQQNLFAKITMGKEGGYPIRKGDILPDGRLVTNIQANFIEVKSGMGKKSNVERLFVTGPVDTSAPASAAPANFNGSSAVSMVPLTPSSALPAVSGPTSMILLPKVVPSKN